VNDNDLIQEFLEKKSESAFRTLVERHAGMVQGVAQRVLGNAHRAEEVTQAVFILLARKASGLRQGTCVAGWLYRTARFVALEAVRSESRREKWHQAYADMDTPAESESIWNQIAPLLDEAMAQLRGADRNAVVLRFLEERTFADVGKAMGTTEAAAKMRVARALEELRRVLARRGVSISGAALMAALSAHSATAAPVGLPATVATIALDGGTAAGSSVAGLVGDASKSLAWAKMKTLTLTCAVSAVVIVGFLALQFMKRGNAQPIAVRSFQPLAGNWTGTFRLRSEVQGETAPTPAELSIRMINEGRECEIEMRISNGPDRVPMVYRFTHQLNDAGNRIITEDDPQIGRSDGEGIVTQSFENTERREWRVTFRTAHEDAKGFSECTWSNKGDELTIQRFDSINAAGQGGLHSELKLRRANDATSKL
jgi:RNA polymerase sigma factor (sigma-70 family)